MGLSESELAQPASSRFRIEIIGGDAVFLADRRLGHKIYLGLERSLTRPEFRRYVASLQDDVKKLSIGELFAKYNLSG